ncbi:DUF6754 domain-containing protein [candidate division CSSED10-310 bacterium]|uniref:DUF6754 domain-containing protein n=1 Tax=candidate division CSSED10-310 bacterium TaxID=2855610 RepID=A0ABV6YXX3_UNCC1
MDSKTRKQWQKLLNFTVTTVFFSLVCALPSYAQSGDEETVSPPEIVTAAEDSQGTLPLEQPVSSPLAPPTNVRAKDKPDDPGGAIIVEWDLSPDDVPESTRIVKYVLLRSENPNGPFTESGTGVPSINMITDSQNVVNGINYYYKVAVDDGATQALSQISQPVQSSAQWFAMNRLNIFVLSVLFSGFILYNIMRAGSGRDLFIRKIAGLNAVEEAIGRATEMGRMVLYIPGIMDMDDVQTIASINILGQVARKTAEYDTTLMVPTCRSVVMSTAQEVVKEAYLSSGRPDAYREDNIRYLTDDQFGYAAGVDGIMLRERPATNFFLGRFYAESLILAETGNFIGAIQIAGTAEASQIPFFITACDYTLIGEELFAAGAYLSREPMLLGSLKGQDWGKLLVMASILLGVMLECFGIHTFTSFFTVK